MIKQLLTSMGFVLVLAMVSPLAAAHHEQSDDANSSEKTECSEHKKGHKKHKKGHEFECHNKEECAKKHAKHMAELDTDGNGSVSEAEFIAFKTAKLKQAFAKIDTDGNGSLSSEEVKNHHKNKKGHKKGHKKNRK